MSQSHSSRSYLPVVAAMFATGLAACSLLVEFDPAGKPCGNGGACLDGYVCDATNTCVLDDGNVTPPPDAGTTPACGGRCTGKQVCLEKRNECVEPGCSTVACAAGEICVIQGDKPTCSVVAVNDPGAQCFLDTECPADEFCLLSSVPHAEASARKGFCTKECTADTDCNPSGVNTRACSEVGAQFRLCMRTAEGSPAGAPRPSYIACQRDDDCADFPGRVCAVFDNNVSSTKTLSGPVSLCDVGLETGLKPGEACQPKSEKAINGICIPGGDATKGYASQRCASDADCFKDSSCQQAQFELPESKSQPETTKFAVRRIDLCVSDSMRCGECESDDDCTPDAPKCVEMPDVNDSTKTIKFCTTECTSRSIPLVYSGCPSAAGWSCKLDASVTIRGVCVAPSCGRPKTEQQQ